MKLTATLTSGRSSGAAGPVRRPADIFNQTVAAIGWIRTRKPTTFGLEAAVGVMLILLGADLVRHVAVGLFSVGLGLHVVSAQWVTR